MTGDAGPAARLSPAGIKACAKRIGEVRLARIREVLGLVLGVVVLDPGRASSLITDFDFTAGYLRDGQYGKLYAKLAEQERSREPASSDSSLSPIGRNRPGKTGRPSGRQLGPPAPSWDFPARCSTESPAHCP